MTSVKELAYIGIEASDLPAWQRFATQIIGMQPVVSEADRLTYRLDDRAHRILIEQGPADDLAFCGYECSSDADLDAIVESLRRAGITVEEGDAELAQARAVDRIFITADPAGNRIELCVGLAEAPTPFHSDLTLSGFFTAEGGACHISLIAMDVQAMIDFYAHLGFRLSDYINMQVAPDVVVPLTFIHCNGRHHTLALAPCRSRRSCSTSWSRSTRSSTSAEPTTASSTTRCRSR